MNFTKEDYLDNIYETSKSTKANNALLSSSESDIDVYNIDKVKEWFCSEYRNDQWLRSCDAYYSDENNKLVMEFKNTNHLKLKEYMGEIVEKILDTHMILAETFYRGQKVSKIGNKVSLLVVFNDELSCGKGIRNFAKALSDVEPKQGDKTRRISQPIFYENDEEFYNVTAEIKKRFCPDFYKEIEFINKDKFYDFYITPRKYFKHLG